jgi:hypothetical protein
VWGSGLGAVAVLRHEDGQEGSNCRDQEVA